MSANSINAIINFFSKRDEDNALWKRMESIDFKSEFFFYVESYQLASTTTTTCLDYRYQYELFIIYILNLCKLLINTLNIFYLLSKNLLLIRTYI